MKTYDVAELAQTLFEEAGDALFLFDPESEQVLDVNPMAQRLTEQTRRQLLKVDVTYLFRSEKAGSLKVLRGAFHKTGLFHARDGFFLRKAQPGQWLPVNLTITRLHTDAGTLGLITARDMTEQHEAQALLKKQEEELRRVLGSVRESEAKYRLLFERNLAGVFRSTAEGALLDCNDSMARILGYDSREDLLSCSPLDFYPEPGDRDNLVWHLREQGNLTNYPVRLRRRDGTPIWVLENVSMLHNGTGQEVLEGTIVDISAQKNQEEALRASEAKYRCLIENLDQCIFLKDRELRFIAANGNFCKGLGLSEAHLLGKTDLDFYPPELAEKYRADDLAVLREGRAIQVEEENVQQGRRIRVRVSKTPFRDEQGRIVGVLGIFWDVTDQAALEAQVRQMQKMEAVGQLAGGVAHDFNNLLTVILGNLSYVLTKQPNPETGQELLRNAEQASLRAAELTRRLLNFSRRTPLKCEPVDLNHAIDEAVRFLRRTIDPRIEIVVQATADLWPVEADPGQINQVLMNLAVNARDAMPEGGKLFLETAHVVPDGAYRRFHLEARPGDFVRLRVRDTGCGMSAEVRGRIFEPFFTTKEPGRGTGLGLANVFGIIKQHKGWIDCQGEPGQGTTFDVFLPRCRAEATTGGPAQPTPPAANSETILLVDDEPMIRALGDMILRRYGYKVLMAEDGLQGVKIFREQHRNIDLVILDGTMPHLSGRDALLQMVEIEPSVRVLFSSGFAAEHLGLDDLTQVVDFIHKPYRVEDLAAKVRNTLARGKPAR